MQTTFGIRTIRNPYAFTWNTDAAQMSLLSTFDPDRKKLRHVPSEESLKTDMALLSLGQLDELLPRIDAVRHERLRNAGLTAMIKTVVDLHPLDAKPTIELLRKCNNSMEKAA